MPHIHSVTDQDAHFFIDAKTMIISCAGDVKTLRRGDHAAERFTFEMPRYIEGHDMSLCNVIQVHYRNYSYDKSTRTTTERKSFDEVEGFKAGDERISFSWLIKGDATALQGLVDFCIRFACEDEAGNLTYQRFTEVFEGVSVDESIHTTIDIDLIESKVEEVEALTGNENLLLNDGGKMKQIKASNAKFGGGGGVTVFQLVPVVNEGGSN